MSLNVPLLQAWKVMVGPTVVRAKVDAVHAASFTCTGCAAEVMQTCKKASFVHN